jgi:hypothetical protein
MNQKFLKLIIIVSSLASLSLISVAAEDHKTDKKTIKCGVIEQQSDGNTTIINDCDNKNKISDIKKRERSIKKSKMDSYIKNNSIEIEANQR